MEKNLTPELLNIDIGNSVFKIASGENRSHFNSKITPIDISMVDVSEAIIYNGLCCAIGQGDYVHDNFKATKDYLEQFILYSIATSTNSEDVNLMLNLPVNQIPNKELLKSRFENKLFQFTINSPSNGLMNITKNINVHKVGVVGESIACYYSLGDELVPFLVVLDIGSKTINYATYTEIGVLDILKSGTLDFGIHELYKNVIEYYKNEYRKTYTISDIDSRIRNNRIEIPKELLTNFIDKIKNSLNAEGFYDFDDYTIKACGGGALVLGEELKKHFSEISILDNALYRNTIGSQLIAEELGL